MEDLKSAQIDLNIPVDGCLKHQNIFIFAVLGIEPMCFDARQTLNHRATSPAHKYF
jgi:hypothetical protein